MDLYSTMGRLSDTIANANTTGYKAERNVFDELVLKTKPQEPLSFSSIETTVRDTSQGGLEATGRQLDAAIRGEGYFKIDSPLGERYTRDGSFTVNAEGILVSQEGYPVLGPGGGNVVFAETDYEVDMLANGIVQGNGEERGQIGVFTFQNEQFLERVGKNLYRSRENGALAEDFEVVQGMLEDSNVNSVTAMTNLIDLTRTIESIKQMESRHHDMQRTAIQRLSRMTA